MEKEISMESVHKRIKERRKRLGLVLNNGKYITKKIDNNTKYLIGINGVIIYR